MEYGDMSEEHPDNLHNYGGDSGGTEAYGEMVADAELPPIPGHDVFAEPAAEESVHEDAVLPEPTALDHAFDYVASIRGDTFSSFLIAIVKQEITTPELQELDEGEDPAESLAAFDQPQTEAGNWQTNHSLNLMSYETALRDAGLALGPDSLSPVFTIADGEKFADMLQALPEDAIRTTTRDGIETAIGRSLQQLNFDHIPTIVDDDYLTYGVPRPAPNPEESDSNDRSYRASAAQALFNADPIVDGLRRIGADPVTIRDLESAHAADVDGVLGHWAVASEWQLYGAPIQGIESRQWTQWLPEEWPRIHTFLDDLEAKAPADSRFVHNLAVTFGANVQLLMDDVYLPPSSPPAAPSWEDDDYEDLNFDYEPSAEVLAEREADDRVYKQILGGVRNRLTAMAARYGQS